MVYWFLLIPGFVFLMEFLRNLFKSRKWHPRTRRVYESWSLGPDFRFSDRKFIVEIIIDGVKMGGSFRLEDRFCEIKTKEINLLIPKKRVNFTKKTEIIDVDSVNEKSSKIITYTVKVKKYTEADIERYSQKYGKKD